MMDNARELAKKIVDRFSHKESGIEWITNPSPAVLRSAIEEAVTAHDAALVAAAKREAADYVLGHWPFHDGEFEADLEDLVEGIRALITLEQSTALDREKAKVVAELKAQQAEREKRLTEAQDLLREVVDGLNCQPGYVRTLTISRIQAALAADAPGGGK